MNEWFLSPQDINSLDVSPNDKLIVSGSQDKTAKVHTPLSSCSEGLRRFSTMYFYV